METCEKDVKKIDAKIVAWKVKTKTEEQPFVKNAQRPQDIVYVEAPKRPQELECDIKKAKVHGESWTIFVGLLNGKPYEIFGGLSKYIDNLAKYKSGKIVKGKKVDGVSVYNLIIGEGEDEIVIKDIASVFENTINGAFTRMISLSLRHGTPIQYMCEQLSKDKHSDMTSFSRVMSRVLKSYIKDGTKPIGKKCENCGEKGKLIYSQGCLSCSSCLHQKCD